MTISAKIIAHSKSSVNGKEIITFELEFPRIVLAEFNTHNMLSKNSSSSRAIPVQTMISSVRSDPAMPVRFGKKNKGMQDAGEHNELIKGMYTPQEWWKLAALSAANFADEYDKAGYAKQICNRLIESFQTMKVVMTATELNNFIWLRDHPAADPTIEALAKAIKRAKENSSPVTLKPGMWHVPYFNEGCWRSENQDGRLEDALAISESCCAQASYRTLDATIEKAKRVSANLNLKGEQPDDPVHASPLEHQATPMNRSRYGLLDEPGLEDMKIEVNLLDDHRTWEKGITHVDRNGKFWSGNLQGWIQHRQLIPNNYKAG